jgi:hypothetical protein
MTAPTVHYYSTVACSCYDIHLLGSSTEPVLWVAPVPRDHWSHPLPFCNKSCKFFWSDVLLGFWVF